MRRGRKKSPERKGVGPEHVSDDLLYKFEGGRKGGGAEGVEPRRPVPPIKFPCTKGKKK